MTFNGCFKGNLWQRVTTGLHFQIPELPQHTHQLIWLLKHPLLSWTGMKIYIHTLATHLRAEAAGLQMYPSFCTSNLLTWPVLVLANSLLLQRWLFIRQTLASSEER